MAEKIKLFLTRNRLFEFDNCVCLSAKYESGFEKEQLSKALKMLFVSQPILSANVELCDDGSAFAVTNKVEPIVQFLRGEETTIIKRLIRDGLCFSEGLFAFYVINEKSLLLLGHTVVCDARSLALLAGDLISFYNREQVSIHPACAQLFSDNFSLPSNVKSPVIERLASDLEVGWQKSSKVFSETDFKKAREKYFEAKSKETILEAEINEDDFSSLKYFCEKNGVDVSSVVAYAFYVALDEILEGKRKYKKINVVGNSRIFFEDSEKYRIGAFDGVVTVAPKKKKNIDNSFCGKVKDFHGEIYKRLTSSFNVFYTDYLQAKIPPSLCDSAYMYCAGLWNQKYSKRLALTYGCANEVMGEFCAYNFDQKYWKCLDKFSALDIIEPLRMRTSCEIVFLVRDGKGAVRFTFKNNGITFERGEKIVQSALRIIGEATKN